MARIDEVEAWGGRAPAAAKNVAAAANGATATAQNYTQDGTHYLPSYANDGQRYCHLTATDADGFWRDEHGLSSWLEIDFNGSKTIHEIDVYTFMDSYLTQSDPNSTQTFSSYGTTGFEVQYWQGSSWVRIPGGLVSANNLVWRKMSFPAVTTTKVKVQINAAPDGVARLTEVEAWGYDAVNLEWLVTDQLGTPRMIFDQSGSLATTKRHDYAPFGEELFNGARTTALGYAADATRQKFTQKERDNETGLDYFLARYYSSTQGRFTSPDEFKGGPEEVFGEVDPHDPLFYADQAEPQSLNKYQYALNNPLRYVDPDGHQTTTADNIKQAASSVAGFVTSAWKGEAKAVANIVIGVSNIGNGAIGGGQTQPYEPNNAAEAYGMRAMEVVTVVGSLIGGKGPAGLMVAETKPTTAVAAELGNSRVAEEVSAASGAARSTNPFKGKSPQQIDEALKNKGFSPRGPDPTSGKGGYVNPRSGRSYHIDPGGRYKKGVEKPHVDVNRPKGSQLPKKKFEL